MSPQVTVMIAAFVVATISPSVAYETLTPPFTTAPVTITSFATPPCSFGGMHVEGLVPGSTVEKDCRTFTCDYNGEVDTYSEHCAMGEFLCADSIPGKCCRTCPNGYNCRTPSGKIIKNGETVTEDSMNCSCSVSDNWWDNLDSDSWDRGAPDGPKAQCTFLDPSLLPNGKYCRTPSGKIIKDGETVTENGMTCTCSLDSWWDSWDLDQNPRLSTKPNAALRP